MPFTNLTGRFIQIRATFTHKTGTNATPWYDLTVSSGTNAVVADPANSANSDRATMLENGGSLVINVLSNDVAPAGAHRPSPRYRQPVRLCYHWNGGTNLIYTPDTNFFGEDRFTYTASDGQGGIGRAVVTVEVGQVIPLPPANVGPPIAQNTNIVVFAGKRSTSHCRYCHVFRYQ